MIRKSFFCIICFLVLCTLNIKASAQEQSRPYLTIGGGLLSYKGDMGSYDKSGMGFNVGLRLTKKKRLNGSFNLGIGSISDDDPNTPVAQQISDVVPNSYFKSSLAYINYTLNLNLIKNEKWWVFVSQGIGFVRFSPKNENGEKLVDLDNTRETGEDYRTSAFMLPTSLGFIYHLSEDWGVGMNTSLLNTQTDYLDNISKLGKSGNDNVLAVYFTLNKKIQLSSNKTQEL